MSNTRKNRLWTVVIIVCAVIAAACIGILAWMHISAQGTERQIEEAVSTPAAAPSGRPTPSLSPSPKPSETPTPEPSPEPTPADVPIDFAYLKEINEDIYGWIELTATEQGYPVVSNEKDPDYYLHRDINRNYSPDGTLYTQSTANELEFIDPCTVIYGHNMNSGKMFGKLQKMARQRDIDDAEAEGNYFTLYTPTKIEKYRICMEGVFSNKNVLYYYDFSDEESFAKFFEDFKTTSTGPHYFCSDLEPQFGDEIVILSTCYSADHTYRFLTIGVMVEKEGTEPVKT